MTYKVVEVIGLPVMEEREIHPGIKVDVPTGETVRKEPGDTITVDELKKHGQSDDDVKKLLKDKAIVEGQ